MPKLLDYKGNVVDNDQWQFMPRETSAMMHNTRAIVPLRYWQEVHANKDHHQISGVWFESDGEPAAVADYIKHWQCIGIHFPGFMDGRGFSLARLLRERYDYQGELRAFGDIIADQLFFLARCGFDTFLINDARASSNMRQYFTDFTVSYQNHFGRQRLKLASAT